MTAPIQIPGLPGKWLLTGARYDFAGDKTKCPNCGGLGFVWSGWFTCNFDGYSGNASGAVALVNDGRCFVPIREAVA